MEFLHIEGRVTGSGLGQAESPEASMVRIAIARGRVTKDALPDMTVEIPFLDAMFLLFQLEIYRQKLGFELPHDPRAH